MKLNCGIVRDLLPLVVDGLAGEESRAAVAEHLAGCEKCSRVRQQLEQDAVPNITPDVPLQRVKREIVTRRRRMVGAVLGVVLAVVFCVFARLSAPVWLPYSETLLTVDMLDSGDLLVTVNQPHAGITVDSAGEETTLSVWKNVISPQNNREMIVIPSDQLGSALYYADFAGDDTLLWGSSEADGRQTLPRLVLNYYLVLVAGMVVVLGIAAAILRKNKAGKLLVYIWLAPVCYVVAHFGVMGLSGVTANSVQSLGWILLTTFSLYLAVTQICRQNR